MNHLKTIFKTLAPTPLLSLYHRALAEAGALACGFPSRRLLVVAVTGTKGKSSTTEMIGAILEEAGRSIALLNSIRIKIAGDSRPNLMRMSMPGRFFIQRFLREALEAKCSAAILETTSEGARQHRHRGIDFDALVFTNLAPEHIESHGSYERYADAKFELGLQLSRSRKRPRIVVANADDAQSARYLALPVEKKIPFSLPASAPFFAGERGGYFTFERTRITTPLPGAFSLKNALAAATLARALGIETPVIARAIEKLARIPGRAEKIEEGQNFDVVVDYAHTPNSLEALYDAYAAKRKICVLGACGGGRDAWKRPAMGKIARERCGAVILTNEDPYDEDPRAIVEALASGMERAPEIVMDRRAAIARGIALAKRGDAVLITGKGTDPSICGPGGSNILWSDAEVAREEIRKTLPRA